MCGKQIRLTVGQESDTQSLSKAKCMKGELHVSNEAYRRLIKTDATKQKPVTSNDPNTAKQSKNPEVESKQGSNKYKKGSTY
tara:strand:- start:209 stop:454 length:246 start_codon:yes stop_codon:yes gene_type:complete